MALSSKCTIVDIAPERRDAVRLSLSGAAPSSASVSVSMEIHQPLRFLSCGGISDRSHVISFLLGTSSLAEFTIGKFKGFFVIHVRDSDANFINLYFQHRTMVTMNCHSVGIALMFFTNLSTFYLSFKLIILIVTSSVDGQTTQ